MTLKPGKYHPELGILNEYGLCFDYVEPETFNDQPEGYYRYQISWGGPSDEFRFWVDDNNKLYKIEYAFLDWFDGAVQELDGKDFDLLAEVFQAVK